MKRLFAFPIVALFALTGFSSAETVTNEDRFRLWNECQPIRLIVKDLNQKAGEIGLNKEDLKNAVRRKLEYAQLHGDDLKNSLLYLNISVVGNAFSVKLEYKKLVRDFASGTVNPATTWDIGGTGTHDERLSYIMSGVSRTTEIFIDEYQRVNAAAC